MVDGLTGRIPITSGIAFAANGLQHEFSNAYERGVMARAQSQVNAAQQYAANKFSSDVLSPIKTGTQAAQALSLAVMLVPGAQPAALGAYSIAGALGTGVDYFDAAVTGSWTKFNSATATAIAGGIGGVGGRMALYGVASNATGEAVGDAIGSSAGSLMFGN